MTDPRSAPHLDLDHLADLEEGLLDAPDAGSARGHLDHCADCRDRLSRLRTTRALLSALPPDPMPGEVAARIEVALAATPVTAGTVVPAVRRRRAWNSPAVAGVAAAAAVVVLIGALVAGNVLHRNGTSTTNRPSSAAAGSTGAGGNAADVKEWSTGADYTPASIARLVPPLVAGTPPADLGNEAAGSSVNPTAPHDAGAATPSSGAASPGAAAGFTQDQLRASREAVLECGRILAGGVATVPVAVDFARFDGKPAVIFALPAIGHPGQLDVWVVRSTCSAQSLDLYFQRINRPR